MLQSILVSGGGIAGSTAAWWLGTLGFKVTVVERATGQRSSGNPVDVRGPALDVIEKMDLLTALRAASTGVTRLVTVDSQGRRIASIDPQLFTTRPDGREMEVPRTDLAHILAAAADEHAEFIYGDSIAALDQHENRVEVSFESGTCRAFDFVVGADGLHSAVRRLAFGAEAGFARKLGMFVATLPLTGTCENAEEVVLFNAPRRSVSIHPSVGTPMAAFIFYSDRANHAPPREIVDQKKIISDAYGSLGWRVPELLERLSNDPDFDSELYFDSMTQIRISRWSVGRVVLVGDAASSVSIFGEGSSLAIAGAANLARRLAQNPDDYVHAFQSYESEHRLRVAPKQSSVTTAARILVPKTQVGILARNGFLRLLPSFTRSRDMGESLT